MSKCNNKLNINDFKYIAYHCKEVYKGKKARPLAWESLEYFKFGHITGYLLDFEGIKYIVFAGTNELRDMLVDAKIHLSHFNGESKGIKVHTGFENAYNLVRNYIMENINQNDKVVIAGHSMGGAIATLLSYKLAPILNNDITCVTFGSPRVGNRAFAKEFKKRVKNSYRVVFRNDAVTKLPIYFRYKHVNTLYQSKRKRWFSFLTAAFDHPMNNYVDGINDDMWSF